MPRIFGDERNELKLLDNISGSEIVLYFRTPTTKERAGYDNESIQRKHNRVVIKRTEARLKYGKKILVGFRSGDFAKKVDGEIVPIASDPKDPHYDPDWKKTVVDNAADLVMLLAGHVFDVSAVIDDTRDDDDEQESEPGEDAGRD